MVTKEITKMFKYFTTVLIFAAILIAANSGFHRQNAYYEAETEYFICLKDLSKTECLTILKDY